MPSKANVRTDEVLLGLGGPLSARGEDTVGKLIDRTDRHRVTHYLLQ